MSLRPRALTLHSLPMPQEQGPNDCLFPSSYADAGRKELDSPLSIFVKTTWVIRVEEEVLVDYGRQYDVQQCKRLRMRMRRVSGGHTGATSHTFT